MFPSLLLIHSLALPVISAVTEQCLQGPPRGPPVWHIRFATTHLSPHPPFPSPFCFWSDYRGSNRKKNIPPSPSPSLPALIHPHTSTLNLSHPLLCSPPQRWQTSRRPVLSLRSNGARFTPEGVLLAWRRAPRLFNHRTETRSFNTADEEPSACLPAAPGEIKTAKDVAVIVFVYT